MQSISVFIDKTKVADFRKRMLMSAKLVSRDLNIFGSSLGKA